MKSVVLINPPLVSDPSDVTGTGIPYWPITLATINTVLKYKYDVKVFDMFGSYPRDISKLYRNYVHGMNIDCAYYACGENDTAVVFANFAISHDVILKIIEILKENKTERIIVVENSQHVAAYPLDLLADDLFKAGADCIICGDPDDVIVDAIEGRLDKIGRYQAVDMYMPDWDGFPIENYWALPWAHAPKTNDKYMPLTMSRGCPGVCKFCTNPYLNNSSWRAGSIMVVFDYIQKWYYRGVKEFHIEDLNPTVDKQRILDLCDMIIKNRMNLDLKIASGTKLETIDFEMLTKMHEAGFSYISFSPESGSRRVLKNMGKSFNKWHARTMTRFIHNSLNSDIITQACFVLGYPKESGCDIELTMRYIKELADDGLDEVAIFNWVPIPGAVAAKGYNIDTNKISFSSDWREYNERLSKMRMEMVMVFVVRKLLKDPMWIFRFRKTKTYMTIKRIILTKFDVIRGFTSLPKTTTI